MVQSELLLCTLNRHSTNIDSSMGCWPATIANNQTSIPHGLQAETRQSYKDMRIVQAKLQGQSGETIWRSFVRQTTQNIFLADQLIQTATQLSNYFKTAKLVNRRLGEEQRSIRRWRGATLILAL